MKPEATELCKSIIGELFDEAIKESMRGWAEATHKHPNSGLAVTYFKNIMSGAFEKSVSVAFARLANEIPPLARQPYDEFWSFAKDTITGRVKAGMSSLSKTITPNGMPSANALIRLFGQEEVNLHGTIHRMHVQSLNKDKLAESRPAIQNASAFPLNFGDLKMGNFDSLMTSTVCILRQNGQRVPNIKASVQKNKIFIMDGTILIEEGDHVEVTSSNGALSVYEVVEPGFHEALGGILAHYQMDVRRVGAKEKTHTGHTIHNTINVGTLTGSLQQGTIGSTQVVEIEAAFKAETQELVTKLRGLVDKIDGL